MRLPAAVSLITPLTLARARIRCWSSHSRASSSSGSLLFRLAQTRQTLELANAIFESLEIFHNRQRRHSALDMLTPVEFETRHQTETVA
jgi:transposase InsO family protein